MVFAGEQADAVDYAVGGNGFLHLVGAEHGPSDHAGRKARAKTGGYGAIRRNAARGYLPGDLVDEVEEGVVLTARRFYRREFFAGRGAAAP